MPALTYTAGVLAPVVRPLALAGPLPIPGHLSTVTVTGMFPTISGAPQDGWATFDPGTVLRNAAGHTILDGAATVRIRGGVMIPVLLPATDNTALVPGGWSYTASVQLGAQVLTGVFALPTSLAPSADLSALLS